MFPVKPYLRYMPDDGAQIDRWGEQPLYRQLAAILRAQIQSGTLRPGQHLPSEATLQQTYGLARNTVRAAVALLRDEGLVITRAQRGSKVADHPGKH